MEVPGGSGNMLLLDLGGGCLGVNFVLVIQFCYMILLCVCMLDFTIYES